MAFLLILLAILMIALVVVVCIVTIPIPSILAVTLTIFGIIYIRTKIQGIQCNSDETPDRVNQSKKICSISIKVFAVLAILSIIVAICCAEFAEYESFSWYLTGILTLILFVVAAFSLALNLMLTKSSNKLLQSKLENESQNKATQTADEFAAIAPALHDFFSQYATSWNKPENARKTVLVKAGSEEQLFELQQLFPDTWFTIVDTCCCWVDNNTFFLLQDEAEEINRALSSPTDYSSREKMNQIIRHLAIPLENIHYFRGMGQLIQSTKIIGTGNITYTGLSVNGVGFGEVKRDPTFEVPDIKDSRYIVFYYREENIPELQALYFGYDSLDTLIRVIPQFEK